MERTTFTPFTRAWPKFVASGASKCFLGIGGFSTALTAVGASVAIGALAVVAPIAVAGGFALTMCVIIAWARPTVAITACLVIASVHRGLFLYLRIEPGGYPLSVFDLLPMLLLVASVSLAVKARDSTRTGRAHLAGAAALILAGLVIGVILGASEGAGKYELLQVIRLEALILFSLVAALVAGHIPQWRGAVLAGVKGIAICVAAQLLITFCWSLATGSYFWSLFPFGRTVDENLLGKAQTGNILVLRENAISGFLILPVLSLLVFRAKGRDTIMLMLLVAAGVVWLSRGLWVAMFVTLLISMARQAASGRLTSVRVATIAVPTAVIVVVVFLGSGGILAQRLTEITSFTGDASVEARTGETEANLDALEEGVGSLVLGLGAGVVVLPEGSSALLENSVLSTWTNGGLPTLIGVTLVFFGAAVRGWRLTARDNEPGAVALGAMGLALPVLWLQGFVSGTLRIEQSALVLFLLAAAVLVTPFRSGRMPQGESASVERG